jgi:folate-binding protein YgfZ
MSISSDSAVQGRAQERDLRGAIAFRGPDVVKFLQGQLSADLAKLVVGGATLAGLHNPQGRVIALLSVTRAADQEFMAHLPLELAAAVAGRLKKYVLRAKVTIEVAGDSPATDPLAEIRAGIPEIYAATSEAFVAQMLNLDLLGAIAFDKGCYTGQEVIARAHYRGRVKRRAQRWRNASGQELKPGDVAQASGGRSLSVVRVATLADGSQELLAVGNFSAAAEGEAASASSNSAVVTEPAAVAVSGPLPIPYELPE